MKHGYSFCGFSEQPALWLERLSGRQEISIGTSPVGKTLEMTRMRLFSAPLATWSIRRAGSVSAGVSVKLWTVYPWRFELEGHGQERERLVQDVYSHAPGSFLDAFATSSIRSEILRWFSLDSWLLPTRLALFVMAFGVGGERFDDDVIFLNALGHFPDKRFGLGRLTCRLVNGGVILLTPYCIHTGSKENSIELQTDCFVVSKEECHKCLLKSGVDFLW